MPQNTFGCQIEEVKITKMTIKSEPLGLEDWNFQDLLFSLRRTNGENFKILKYLTWHGFDEFGWTDPYGIFHDSSLLRCFLGKSKVYYMDFFLRLVCLRYFLQEFFFMELPSWRHPQRPRQVAIFEIFTFSSGFLGKWANFQYLNFIFLNRTNPQLSGSI